MCQSPFYYKSTPEKEFTLLLEGKNLEMPHLSWAPRAKPGLVKIEEGGENARKDEVAKYTAHENPSPRKVNETK